MSFISNDHTIRNLPGGGGSPEGSPAGSPVIRPDHCGEAMQLTIHKAAAAEDSSSLGLADCTSDLRLLWQCHCGFRLDPQPDPREEVWAAAARVESSRWEMDHALIQLHRALHAASAKGMPNDLLAESAQLSLQEIQIILDPGNR